ncbi:peroxidasin homolog, partial [Nilaparvata lugens]|uniref:peroxidasin homolog n=1 Tax=Nilaparvata lugens TaxID=108931 RepID=UPI00193D772C
MGVVDGKPGNSERNIERENHSGSLKLPRKKKGDKRQMRKKLQRKTSQSMNDRVQKELKKEKPGLLDKERTDLRFNRIKEIPPDTFKNLSKLHTLLLNNNQLSKLQNGVFNGLQELRYLYLYKNKLKEIEDRVFQDLNKLEQLYLHFNKIEKLGSGIFSDMKNLERLFLHNNKLKHISPGAFNHLDNLKRLRLDSNALVCDCEMMWLAKLLQEKRQITQAAATCQFPTTMEGKSLAEVNDNDFHC